MKMESRHRDYCFDPSITNGRGSFQEHNEQMKAFCRSHTNIAVVNSPWYNQLGILKGTCPLQLRLFRKETGGSRLVNVIDDWSTLVPVLEERRHRFWKN